MQQRGVLGVLGHAVLCCGMLWRRALVAREQVLVGAQPVVSAGG